MPLDHLDAAEAAAWLRVAFAPDMPPRERVRLLRVHGSAQALLRAAREDPRLAESAVGAALRAAPAPARVEDTLRWLEHERHFLLVPGDPRYPTRLLDIGDPPLVLFARGDPAFLAAPQVAIVGSRNASAQGRIDAEALAEALSHAGLCIASGLALGIDAAAHRGGLSGPSSTVAVMGTGPDILYPKSNRELALEIEARGCILSEFPLGTGGLRGNFPKRNRLISGLALGVVVVEAARESGSLVTARAAGEQGREVMAMPGSVHSSLSKGCHALIRDGATLVETADDVLLAIRWQGPRVVQDPDLDPGQPDAVLDAVGYAPTSMDRIAEATGLAYPALAARLSRLEVEGRIAALAGGRFVCVAKPARTRVIE